MVRASIGLCGGLLALALPWQPGVFDALPWLSALFLAAGAGLAFRFGASSLVVPAAAAVGLWWGWFANASALAERVPTCVDADYRLLTAEVVTPPLERRGGPGGRTSSLLEVEVVDSAYPAEPCAPAPGARLRLTWFDPPVLGSGQRWVLSARVRPPWGYRNAAGFDYERWLLGRGLDGTGYVRSGELLRDGFSHASGFRKWLRDRGTRQAGLVVALTEGDRSGVSEALWEVLRNTGTVHLLVVSGLHVGLVCGTTFVLCVWVLRFPALWGSFSAEPVAAVLALAVGGWYVVASGSGPPALRAWLMATAVLLLRIGGWRSAPGAVLLLVLVVLLALDPLLVHQQGAYLSFAAVAVLLLSGGGLAARTGLLAGLARAQFALFLGLCPLLAVQQGVVPGAGVLANLLAVPLLTLLLPMLLLTMLCWSLLPALAALLATGGELLLELLVAVLKAAAVSPVLVAPGASTFGLIVALAAALLLLARPDPRLWVLLLPAWLVWLAPSASRVPPDAFRVTALDVGQGSAVLVDTRGHRLLFDTGPVYPGGFDLGAVAVVPSVRATGPDALDALVLSHADVDHAGGAASVLGGLRVDRVFSSFALDHPDFAPAVGRSFRCTDAVHWRWDGVEFRFLHPDAAAGGSSAAADNDRSCVLRVSSGQQTLLLSGDISRRVERRLARRARALLQADVITAPHHGSRTSSSREWLAATRPRIVLVSAPRRSRYGHPHPLVLARYASAGSRVLVTGLEGAVVWESWRPGRVRAWRREAPYWVNRPQTSDARADRGD